MFRKPQMLLSAYWASQYWFEQKGSHRSQCLEGELMLVCHSWFVEQWKTVVWPDKLYTLCISSQMDKYEFDGKPLLPGCTVSTIKFRGGAVTWNCFLDMGLEAVTHGKMTAKLYYDILDNKTLPMLWHLRQWPLFMWRWRSAIHRAASMTALQRNGHAGA